MIKFSNQNLNNLKTIAAISTPAGVGGLAVIRISGNEAIEIADKIFKSKNGISLADVKGYHAKLGNVVFKGEIIDEAIALIFKSPRSYTGEDIVEISVHGGIFLAGRVLKSALSAGARMAGAGEFTKRAFLNKKMSLDKAESVMSLIHANHEKARSITFSAFNGRLGEKIKEIKEVFIDILSDINAQFDYPEEDIPEFDIVKAQSKIDSAIKKILKLINSYSFGRIIKTGIKTAIIGSPNVGKSTLMNLLTKFERSIVTDMPGTTRDIIEEIVILNDIPLVLVDTAGIRNSDNEAEKIGVKRAVETAHSSEIILAVFDASREVLPKEIDLIKSFNKKKVLSIINKTDLENKIKIKPIEENSSAVAWISAKTGKGLKNLSEKIQNMMEFSLPENEDLVVTNERQYDILQRAFEFAETAKKFLSLEPLDITAQILKDTLDVLTEFTGENAGEEVIEAVFSKFCVGK
jgi:tRNA modification GTPase